MKAELIQMWSNMKANHCLISKV